MTDAPVAPEAPPKNPIEALLEAAWESVREMLGTDSDRWTAAVTSPIAKSSEPARQAIARQVQEEQMGAIVHAAMEFQLRLALAQKHRSVNMQVIAPLLQDIAGFAQAVAQERGVSCRAVGCDFRGSAADAGPVGVCPKCDGRVTPDAPEKKILGPTGQVLQA